MGRNSLQSPGLDLWLALHHLQPAEVDCSQGTLFRRGENCHGVYLVEEGRLKLSLSPEGVMAREFEIVGAGTVLALAEAMTGGTYCRTAEAAEGARITCIERQSFLQRLYQDQQLCLWIVHLLSEDLHSLYHRFRRSSSAASCSGERDSTSMQ